jgi:hypothetical protein
LNRRSFSHPGLFETLEHRRLLAGNVIYVDADVREHSPSDIRDGTNWANAYDDLQAALSAAEATSGADEIWIAQGTYKPSQVYAPGGVVGGHSGLAVDNLKTFNLPDGVTLYGGFAYGQKSLGQRNPVLRPTILDGDLNGDDVNTRNPGLDSENKGDNAWHVVTLGDDVTQTGVSATLDGLVIINGYAAGPNIGGTLEPFVQGHSNGGGVFAAFGSDLTITKTRFQ